MSTSRRHFLLAFPTTAIGAIGCAQGTLNRSAADVIGSVILAGTARGTGRGTAEPTARPSASAARVMDTADNYLGVPYKWGGNTPAEGFDCSGYVKYVYARQGIQLPRTSREQAGAGQPLPMKLSALLVGDIILFAEPKKAISHVAIYAGDGQILHSSSSGRGVRYDDLDSQRGAWFRANMVRARRLVSDGMSLVQTLDLLTIPGLSFDPPDRAPSPFPKKR